MNLYLIILLLGSTIHCKDINLSNFPGSSRHIIYAPDQGNSSSHQDLNSSSEKDLISSSQQNEYLLNSSYEEDEEDIYESSSIDSNSSEFSYQSEREDSVVTVNVTADSDVTVNTDPSPRNVTAEKDVVVIKEETDIFPFAKSVFQRSLEWMEDAYTLSILMPIAAGVVFALTVILMLATCRCLRRCRRRKRFRKKALPESIKNLTASDRARLLGDFSDEEF